ncbi:MAG: SDR family oxidoreductase [Acidobacteriota bacterium]|nr:MAG: SDR family oxidoreductase [Acidobacteriota bacterium]
MDIQGKTAIITGGSRGIGYAVAEALAARGMKLAVCSRTESELRAAEKRLAGQTEVLAQPVDVSDERQVEAFVGAVRKRFGPPYILVNNAGVIGPYVLVEDIAPKGFDEVLAINLRGAFLMTRAVLAEMKKQRDGYIVNVSSVSGKEGDPKLSAYSASKFGMVGFTESLIEEARSHNVRACSICPNYVDTLMSQGDPEVPDEEMLRPEDIAKTVLWLLDLSPVSVVKEVVLDHLVEVD